MHTGFQLIAVGIVVGLGTSSCRRGTPPQTTGQRGAVAAADKLAQVDASDGIDATEAAVLAAVYFERNVAEFGWTGVPTRQHPGDAADSADIWRIPVFQGVKGRLLPDVIAVDARTGAVSFPRRRSFGSVAELKSSLGQPR